MQDGQHSISFHSDDEQFLGPLPCIASLSLGGSRDFLLKHKQDAQRKEKYLLESGDLIVMRVSVNFKGSASDRLTAGSPVWPTKTHSADGAESQ